MKTSVVQRILVLVTLLAVTGGQSVWAEDLIKDNNTDALNLGSSWVDGVVPGASDVAVWDSTVTAGSLAVELGADLAFQGIRIENPAGRVDILGEDMLTLGSAGIELTSRSLNIVPEIRLSTNQTWSIGSGLFLDDNGNANNQGVWVDNQGHDFVIDIAGVSATTFNYVNLRHLEGSGSMTIDGAGRVRFTGANTNFTGDIVVNSGVLRAANEATSLGAGSSTLTLNGGQLTFGSNNPRNFGRNTTVGGDVELNNNNSQNNNAQSYTFGTLAMGAHTLSVTAQGGTNGNEGNILFGATTLSGSPVFNVATRTNNHLRLGAVSESGGSHGITKTGVGMLILNGNSTYSGGTTVSEGTLLVNNTDGSGTGTGSVTVASGAVLGGSGLIAGPVSLADGAVLSPGNSAGTLTVGELILSEDSGWQWELGAPWVYVDPDSLPSPNDFVQVDGDLVLDGRLKVVDLGGLASGTYTLARYTGALTDHTLAVDSMPAGFAGTIVVDAVNQLVNLVVSDGGGDPEPPEVSLFRLEGGDVQATFMSEVGTVYALWYTTDLVTDPVVWTEVASVTGDGDEQVLTDENPVDAIRLYAIMAE
jgi:autotransporter-associated beta strand protein